MAIWDDEQRPPPELVEGVDTYGVITNRSDFNDWLEHTAPQELRDLEGTVSDQWLVMLAAQDAPGLDEWEHATIHRGSDGDWSVSIIDERGDAHTINLPGGDRDARALFFDDLYAALGDYDVDVARDIDSPGDEAV